MDMGVLSYSVREIEGEKGKKGRVTSLEGRRAVCVLCLMDDWTLL